MPEEARRLRGEIEAALDRVKWRWSATLSVWLDGLVAAEERARGTITVSAPATVNWS